MGVDFRGAGYVRRVKVGKRTVKAGEAVAVWDQNGRHKEIVGPALVRLYFATIRFLNRHVAEAGDYLRIHYTNGTVEHKRGPLAFFENPVHHISMTVEKSIVLDSQECLVVRRVHEENEKARDSASSHSGARVISQEIIDGPLTFFPEASDVVKVFKWTDKGAGLLRQKSQVVNLSATTARVLECDLRGADGHKAQAKVMLRVSLVGIKESLAVADPIAECDALARMAVLEASAGLVLSSMDTPLVTAVRDVVTGSKFTQGLTKKLHEGAACSLISVMVEDVTPSAQLEKLLRQEDDVAAAKINEQIADAALKAAAARQEAEHDLETSKQAHSLKLEAEREKAASERKDLEAQRALEFLKDLKTIGGDVTRYLEASALGSGATPGVVVAQGAKKVGGGWW